MPITDYNNTIMYKIVCDDLNVKDCYVGHTINMTKRKCWHKSSCNNEKNKNHNLKIYQILVLFYWFRFTACMMTTHMPFCYLFGTIFAF